MRTLLLLLVLAGAVYGGYLYYQAKLAAALELSADPPMVDAAPAVKTEPLEAEPMVPVHLLWTQDPRWQRALDEGELAMQKAIALYKWQEAEGGDPIRFRREKLELYRALSPIIEGLEQMKLEYPKNPGVLGNLNLQLRKFSAATSGVLR
jgi:hypothetical protein